MLSNFSSLQELCYDSCLDSFQPQTLNPKLQPREHINACSDIHKLFKDSQG